MKTIIAVAKKEFTSYFNAPLAYIFLILFLVVSQWLFMRTFFLSNISSMRTFFSLVPWMLVVIVPVLSMRLWAEEKKLGTMELLLTWPVKDYEVILGKFLGSLAFMTLTLVATIALPIVVYMSGSPDTGVILGGYFGLWFLSAAFLSIGMFASSTTDNSIVAFIVAAVMSFLLYIIGSQNILAALPGVLGDIARTISIGSHYSSITRGVVDTRDIIYAFSLIFFFLLLNARNIAKRS